MTKYGKYNYNNKLTGARIGLELKERENGLMKEFLKTNIGTITSKLENFSFLFYPLTIGVGILLAYSYNVGKLYYYNIDIMELDIISIPLIVQVFILTIAIMLISIIVFLIENVLEKKEYNKLRYCLGIDLILTPLISYTLNIFLFNNSINIISSQFLSIAFGLATLPFLFNIPIFIKNLFNKNTETNNTDKDEVNINIKSNDILIMDIIIYFSMISITSILIFFYLGNNFSKLNTKYYYIDNPSKEPTEYNCMLIIFRSGSDAIIKNCNIDNKKNIITYDENSYMHISLNDKTIHSFNVKVVKK